MERTANTPAWMNVSEIEIVYKSKVKAADRPQIKSSKDAYDLLRNTWDDNKLDLVEQFKILLLNRANRVLGLVEISTGGITGTVADPRLILGVALKSCACGLLLSHSHPSANTRPSRADEELTTKIAAAAALMDIKLLDHLIITREDYYSFSDQGLL
jgi:DNA repair protein RadC